MEIINKISLLKYYLKKENKYAIFLKIAVEDIPEGEYYGEFKEYLGDMICDNFFQDDHTMIIFEKEDEMREFYWEKFSDGNPQADTQDNPRPGFPRIYALTLGPNGSLDENT